MVMKRSRLLFVVGIFTVTVLFFFSGAAPDGVYKIIPGYFADPNRMWTKTPLDEGSESKPYLPEILLYVRKYCFYRIKLWSTDNIKDSLIKILL